MTKYLITFSSGAPRWETSKWKVSSISRSDALHQATLMHEDLNDHEVNMITLSKAGMTDVDEDDFYDLDTEGSQKRLEILDKIYRQQFNHYFNV